MAARQWEYLAVIERAVYGEIVHIRVHDRSHLCLLYRTNFALGVHDEY
jgi:hypothetical protein